MWGMNANLFMERPFSTSSSYNTVCLPADSKYTPAYLNP